MKNLILSFLAILFGLSLTAQTPEQLTRVLKETNRAKLQTMSNIYRQKAEEQKALAIEAALENGWPITIETDSSFSEIQSLDEFGNPVYYITHNSNAAKTVSTNKLYSGGGLGLNLSGSGMLVGEWDGAAVFTSHEDFNNTGSSRVTQKDAAVLDHWHATHVAGTIIGGGLYLSGGNSSIGMAYNASLYAYDWNTDVAEMTAEAANGLLLSNHSYGFTSGWSGSTWYGTPAISVLEDYGFGFYSSEVAAYDNLAVSAPYYLIVKSAGNDRDDTGDGSYPDDGPYDCIGWIGNAKNILTVGAVKDLTGGYTGNPADVLITDFSSWGPADDGRIKPDICGNGYDLISAYWHSGLPGATYFYAGSSGTSMSAPNVTGSLLLLQEHYYNLNSAYMKSATLKALAIQTADECGPDDGPDYMFGWGLLNAETAANVITNRNTSSLITEETYDGSTTYSVTVTANGSDPLRATLVWTDPAGTPPVASLDPADIMLVNDLDMTITGAKTNYSPYKLDKDNPADAATTGDNDVDNVEQIHIASPTSSVYTITITHEGSISGGSQNFSLIVTGIVVEEPAVVTYEPSDVTATSVTFDGETTSENGFEITERGFVYSTSPNPDINDTKIVVGSGLGAFNTSVGGLTPNTTYHVRAYATNSQGTAYGVDKDFTTTSTTTWDGAAWDGGAPTASIHAVINGNYTTSGNLECNNLTINSGKTFNLSVNNGVTVNGDFVNNGTFNILSSAAGIGSLITLGDVTNSGTFNMERYASEDAWHYLSSPLLGNTSNVFSGSYMQIWDEVTANWIEITETNEPLVKGSGYSIWSYSKNNMYTFSGTPYTGNQIITMTKTANGNQYSGANLLGNPFPSSIDWNLLDGVGYGAVYTYDGANEQYLSWNGSSGAGSRYIAPGQGFFIGAEYTGTFNLGDADRVHLGTNIFVKEEKIINNGVVLTASNEVISDEVWIGFVSDATPQFERKYDAYKFFSSRADLPNIYTINEHTDFSIDKRPETNTIQLGFACQTNGIYQISIQQFDGLASIEIEDTKTQKMHDLKSGAYHFDWQVGDIEERFILHLSATATEEIETDDINIYTINNQVYLNNIADSDFRSIKLYNINGQLVYESELSNKNLQMFATNAKKGVYLIQLIGKNQQQTEKIIIK
jgi:hypothetical protein